ncbi:5-formyltetrahydrofolate cyclo-ligase [Streptomyces tsukubensis]|uniref:5-formyltetrahydrofolate cyclo-ligase n=1 Tax=Streptomyces tsukubensis TaxID=83656 RepID=A0A1V4A5A0_9ACTN|nr:5-formyltetrahydrofolate cyclo-ligase [Streptomyces tsukubensis]OON75996.1 5-formyltetrahydrofolate cyclo-ligase [Streptomyces tsukubensis]QFR94086.1 5-formyltetrahydrofolate cyclo-ligase [Streptomyces tsukubensis]
MANEETSKRTLRAGLLSMRKRLTAEDAQEAGVALASLARGVPELVGASTVAAYVSVGREPSTRALLDTLHSLGVRVLLPVLLPDNDLDWAPYEGPASLAPVGREGRLTLLEPTGKRLGPDAVLAAEAVLLPGLAVDGRGMRLGRGGGSYDRALARLAAAGAEPALLVLLYDHEVIDHVPAQAHDRPVHAALTPSGVRHFG